MEEKKICMKAIKQFGEKHQIIKAIEELSELTHALCRYLNGLEHNVCEEIADSEIVIIQLKSIFRESEIDGYKYSKLDRLQKMLK